MSEVWDDDYDDLEPVEQEPKKRRGRPPGSSNKASKAQIDRVCADGGTSPP